MRILTMFIWKRTNLLIGPSSTLVAAVGLAAVAANAPAQGTASSPAVHQRSGGFVPGQKRPPEDPAKVARGKTLFEINCRSCHGADLRGGDMGGPNLLRSQVALADQQGELIVPIIQGSRQKMGMPAIGLSTEDSQAVAAYVRTVMGRIGVQGKPPAEGEEPSILVGNASEGNAYFAAKCAGCHSPIGDLKGLASRIPDQKRLQSTWVAGGLERGEESDDRLPTAEVTFASGEQVTGHIVHIDEFLITLKLSDGTQRSIARTDRENPRITIHDPLEKHREMLSEYTDKDIHDVTAYLVTLK
jgi:cytochrome c oxidase cbb3-type subunit 3